MKKKTLLKHTWHATYKYKSSIIIAFPQLKGKKTTVKGHICNKNIIIASLSMACSPVILCCT